MAAPRISQLGGGIAREDIGNSTQRYEEYFDGANGAGTGNGASQRTSNYADVVNKCVGFERARGASRGLCKLVIARTTMYCTRPLNHGAPVHALGTQVL
jgi:hypothetical protein